MKIFDGGKLNDLIYVANQDNSDHLSYNHRFWLDFRSPKFKLCPPSKYFMHFYKSRHKYYAPWFVQWISVIEL